MQDFLCTYTVKTREQYNSSENEQAQENADSIRHDIRNVPEWNTIDNIETTITGSLYLTGTIAQKRARAEDIIRTQMREIVDEYDAYNHVDIECAFMVDGLGEIITFSI